MYTIHIMNLKINIWPLNFLFKSENCYFNCLKHYLNFRFWIEHDIFNLNLKRLIWSKIWYLNYTLIFFNPKISISIQKIIIDCKNGHFNFEYFNINFKIYISTLKFFHLNFKIIIWFEPEILIPNYYFRFSELILLVWKLLIEPKNGHFNFEYFYLTLQLIVQFWKFLFKFKKLIWSKI